MRREIKYIAKCKLNSEWVKGEPHISCVKPHIHSDGHVFPIMKETLGQFTGVTDVNGEEIYEGFVIQSVKYPKFDTI